MESEIKLNPIRKITIKMNIASCFLKTFLAILLSVLYFSANGQKLIESRQTSHYTYIYKISNKEAKKVYKKISGR